MTIHLNSVKIFDFGFDFDFGFGFGFGFGFDYNLGSINCVDLCIGILSK